MKADSNSGRLSNVGHNWLGARGSKYVIRLEFRFINFIFSLWDCGIDKKTRILRTKRASVNNYVLYKSLHIFIKKMVFTH